MNTQYRYLLEKYIINRIQNDIVTLDNNHWSPMYTYDPDGYITVRMNDELLVWCTPFMVDSDEIAFDMEEFEDGESTRSYSNREMLLTGDLHVDFETYKRIVNDEITNYLHTA